MPPRKTKTVVAKPAVDETPVVFYLKITEDSNQKIIPAGDATSYSDILNSVEITQNIERFNTDLLKTVLSKVQVERYTPQTACFWCAHHFDWAITTKALQGLRESVSVFDLKSNLHKKKFCQY
jgi:uncharacterized protein (UPF0212 family)